jgi:hypothetical protein
VTVPPHLERDALLRAGEELIEKWCRLNHVEPPLVRVLDGDPEFVVCAYYRSGLIKIWPKDCAPVGLAGRAWSWPGYSTDRTPYGVLAHELCHHVEHAHGAEGGIVAMRWRERTNEQPLTSYCPNDNEWLAEIFRLYVTNPSLLAHLRPRTYELLCVRWPWFAETRHWTEILEGAERQLAVARKRVAEAVARAARSSS